MLFDLITFEFDTYSFSGKCEDERFLFSSRVLAENKAKELKLSIRIDYVENPLKECLLIERNVDKV